MWMQLPALVPSVGWPKKFKDRVDCWRLSSQELSSWCPWSSDPERNLRVKEGLLPSKQGLLSVLSQRRRLMYLHSTEEFLYYRSQGISVLELRPWTNWQWWCWAGQVIGWEAEMLKLNGERPCQQEWAQKWWTILGTNEKERIKQWAFISYSRGSSQPRDRTHVSCISRQILYHCATWEKLIISIQIHQNTIAAQEDVSFLLFLK